MKAEIYYAITGPHKGTFSIRALEGADKGRVIGHAHTVTMSDVTFTVRQGGPEGKSGRRAVLRTGQKNIHALVRGTITDWSEDPIDTSDPEAPRFVRVRYNPRENETFVTDAGPIFKAERVILSKRPDGHPVVLALPIEDGFERRSRLIAEGMDISERRHGRVR